MPCCDPGIQIPPRQEDPEWNWKSAEAPCFVKCCVMSTQNGMKQYKHIPLLAPFSCCIDPLLNPCLGTLNYCIVKYAIKNFKFGGKQVEFKGDYCSYNCVLCKSTCTTCLTCGVWYHCMGGEHVMPTYLDQHVCWVEEDATFKPGDRYEDAGRCAAHFEQVREKVLNKKNGYLDHMYIMQNTPGMPFCDMCKNACSCDFGTKQMLAIENQLRYTRIGGQQMKFLGSADGFNATQPGCGYMCAKCPCYFCHNCVLGTYKDAVNQYTDNNLEWMSTAEVADAKAQDFSIEGALPSMGGLFGGGGNKVHPEPADTAPGTASNK